MENVLNKISDATKMVHGVLQVDKVNAVLQVDKVNTSVDDAETNISNWVGLVYDMAAIIFLLCAVYHFINPFMDNVLEGADGKISAGIVLSSIVWLYAAFPLASVIRRAGENLRAPSDSIITYVFKDFVIANIRMVGQMMAIAALFAAVNGLINWAADIPMNLMESSMDLGVVNWMAKVPFIAAINFADFIGFESVANELIGGMASWDLTDSGTPQTVAGFIAACYSFAAVVLILINLYVAIAIYNFFFALANTFLNWVKSPYLPMKSL